MEKTVHHRGCRIDVVVLPTSGPKLKTSYTITPETDEAKDVYGGFWRGVAGSGSGSYADLDQFNGPDPLAEAAEFTASEAKAELDGIWETLQQRRK